MGTAKLTKEIEQGWGMTTEERIESLERELGRAKWQSRLLVLAAAIVVTAMFMARTGMVAGVVESQRFALSDVERRLEKVADTVSQQTAQAGKIPTIIRAEHFALVDEHGKIRGGLGGISTPEIYLCDRNEKTRIVLTMDKEEPMLRFYDENGKTRMFMTGANDVTGLYLANEQGRSTAWFATSKKGPSMSLYDFSHSSSAVLSASDDGFSLSMTGENKAYLSLDARSNGSRISMGVNRKLCFALSASETGGMMFLHDESGKPVWVAPR